MTIETAVLTIAAMIGFTLPDGIISFDAPVAINDSMVLDCINSSNYAAELMESLGFPEKWHPDNFETVLPVHIAVPEKPSLILLIFNNTDETQGYLLSCSDQGSIIDSIPAYYWNSEGSTFFSSFINTDGSIIMDYNAKDGWGHMTDTTFLQTDGSFTMNRPSVLKDPQE